jgi:hypothetical protein
MNCEGKYFCAKCGRFFAAAQNDKEVLRMTKRWSKRQGGVRNDKRWSKRQGRAKNDKRESVRHSYAIPFTITSVACWLRMIRES